MQTTTQTFQNVEIKNLTSWPIYFKLMTSGGDKLLKPADRYPEFLEFNELVEQIKARNNLFTGTDDIGSHARVQIVDDEVRRQLLGNASDNATILTLDAVKELLAIKQKDAFSERLKTLVVTDAERRMIVELAVKAGVDDAPSWMRDEITSITGNVIKNLSR